VAIPPNSLSTSIPDNEIFSGTAPWSRTVQKLVKGPWWRPTPGKDLSEYNLARAIAPKLEGTIRQICCRPRAEVQPGCPRAS